MRSHDPRTVLVSNLVFPLHEWLKRHDTVRVLRSMERTQWLPETELAALQEERLCAFLASVAHRVPYYRDLLAGIRFGPGKARGFEVLRTLPLLTKDLIREHARSMRAERVSLATMSTGGSTGVPLQFLVSRERVSHDVAAKWRATRWWGVDIGDPEIVVWGSPIEAGRQDRLRALRDRLVRSTLLPAFDMSARRVASFLDRIRAVRPRMLFGYPSALALIAGRAEAAGRRMDDLGIRVAFVTGEVLYPHQRETIARVFGCRVANGYGGRDAGFVAHECPEGGMHVTAEDIIVELLGRDGLPVAPGAEGEIVITHLATRDFPFVRYRTGDVATRRVAPCACGRALPLLGEIRGRSTDFVIATDGTVLHGLSLIYVLRDLAGIREFRIVQESLARVRVQVVAPGPLADDLRAAITRGFRARLGAELEVIVERVEAIEADPSGKHRYVVSHVPPPAAAG